MQHREASLKSSSLCKERLPEANQTQDTDARRQRMEAYVNLGYACVGDQSGINFYVSLDDFGELEHNE